MENLWTCLCQASWGADPHAVPGMIRSGPARQCASHSTVVAVVVLISKYCFCKDLHVADRPRTCNSLKMSVQTKLNRYWGMCLEMRNHCPPMCHDSGGDAFSTTGARETHHFSKSLRLSTKFKTLAPVDKSWHRSEQKYAFRLSFGSEKCVFAVPVQWNGCERFASQARNESH